MRGGIVVYNNDNDKNDNDDDDDDDDTDNDNDDDNEIAFHRFLHHANQTTRT